MNSDWKKFLLANQAILDGELVADFGDPGGAAKVALSQSVITDLSYLAIIEIAGDDAKTFLNSQFTIDLTLLEEGSLSHGGWCNQKGRVFVNFLIFNLENIYYLLLSSKLKQSFIQRLKMYVLRADVAIHDRCDDIIRIGVRGKEIVKTLAQTISNLPATPLNVTRSEGLMAVSIPDNIPRLILLGAAKQIQTIWEDLATEYPGISSQYWQLYDILCGIPWVDDVTTESFLPQTLNLDCIGGLDFNKGCYLGQEIISRLHFRGSLKQRMYLAKLSTGSPPAPGTKLYSQNTERSIGTVINTANHPDNAYQVLAAIDMDQTTDNNVHLNDKSGPVLMFEPLPYAFDEN